MKKKSLSLCMVLAVLQDLFSQLISTVFKHAYGLQ